VGCEGSSRSAILPINVGERKEVKEGREVKDCTACGGSGIDHEAEFDRACLVCGGYGTTLGEVEYQGWFESPDGDIEPYYFSGTMNEEGEVYGG
jgi:hypothetical protein